MSCLCVKEPKIIIRYIRNRSRDFCLREALITLNLFLCDICSDILSSKWLESERNAKRSCDRFSSSHLPDEIVEVSTEKEMYISIVTNGGER